MRTRSTLISTLFLSLLLSSCASRTVPADGPQVTPVQSVPSSVERAQVVPETPQTREEVLAQAEVGQTIVEDDSAELQQHRAPPPEHPLQSMTEQEIARRVKQDLGSLGSMSLGAPNSGALLNGVQLPEESYWVVVDPSHAWGTAETVRYLQEAVSSVAERFPNATPLHVGHLSGPKGGKLNPHRSHQSGRDVDLGYYYTNGEHWYQRATADNLDVERTWALVRSLVINTDVRFILMDYSVQRLVREHAEKIGESPGWLETLFKGGRGIPAMIRHVRGHATHMHVRFYNPVAQESARRAYSALVAQKLVKPPVHYIWHKVKKGDSLIKLAKRYGTTVRAIQRANGLRSTKIFARKSYKIPRTGPAASPPVNVPPRRLPPDVLAQGAKGATSLRVQ